MKTFDTILDFENFIMRDIWDGTECEDIYVVGDYDVISDMINILLSEDNTWLVSATEFIHDDDLYVLTIMADGCISVCSISNEDYSIQPEDYTFIMEGIDPEMVDADNWVEFRIDEYADKAGDDSVTEWIKDDKGNLVGFKEIWTDGNSTYTRSVHSPSSINVINEWRKLHD